jgi:acetyl-CoA carboxylase carboxyltransferase component
MSLAYCIMYRFDAIQMAREWVGSLAERQPSTLEGRISIQPRYPMDDILSIMNPDIRKPFDMFEVLLRLAQIHGTF